MTKQEAQRIRSAKWWADNRDRVNADRKSRYPHKMSPLADRTSAMKLKVSNLLDAQVGYLAGLIDGEGSVFMRPVGSNLNLGCRIQVANTDTRMMDWLYEHIGGTVYWRPGWKSSKPIAVWQVGGGAAAAICERVYPYLMTHKREKAKIVVELFTVYSSPGLKLSKEEIVRRRGILERFKSVA